jgi:glycosyltransferase involved in cell wall biosynthesis
MAALGDEELELQVEAWGRELAEAGAGSADLLYLHHLTPLHEAALRRFGGIPVVTHIHGSELLMMERIERGPPPGWDHAPEWLERMRAWAAASARLIANSPAGLERAAALLRLPRERFLLVPNGVEESFAPRQVDRIALWRRHLVDDPLGWRPGEGPGSARYSEDDLAPLAGTVLLYTGRFTRVKRLPLLISAFHRARERFAGRTALVLLGGYPGEWEDEHPIETVRRLESRDVFLAGWHSHDELPDFFAAADILVHPSVREQFGQVVVEAMVCGLPPIAVDRVGPAAIVVDGDSGWLVPPDNETALVDAMAQAVNEPRERKRRGANAHRRALDRYTWPRIGARLADHLRDLLGAAPAAVRGSAGSSRSRTA